jgi:hypothetical protein
MMVLAVTYQIGCDRSATHRHSIAEVDVQNFGVDVQNFGVDAQIGGGAVKAKLNPVLREHHWPEGRRGARRRRQMVNNRVHNQLW